MSESYILKNKNISLGTLTYDEEADKFNFSVDVNLENTKLLPLLMYPLDKRTLDYNPSDKGIRKFIKNRIVPEDRDGIDSIISSLGISYYDMWTICKINRGMCMEDYIWLSKENEQFENCHIRYLSENGRENCIPKVLAKFRNEVC